MGAGEEELRAEAWLVLGDREVPLGPLLDPTRCDLGFVEDLARLHLAARRMGGSLRLSRVRADLHELLDLLGLASCLER